MDASRPARENSPPAWKGDPNSCGGYQCGALVSSTLSPAGTGSFREISDFGATYTSSGMAPRVPRVTSVDSLSGVDPQVNFVFQATLMFLVVALGCIDVILRQIVAKTLGRFTYVLGVVTSVAYLPVYWGALFTLIQMRVVPISQVHWVWDRCQDFFGSLGESVFSRPYVKLFMVASLGDAVGNGLGYICTPYVSGPVHSLLAQFTIMFTAGLSICLLDKRYSLAQVLGLVGVEIAVLIGVLPSFGKGENESSPFFCCLLAFSCFFNAFAWILKESAFRLYRSTPISIESIDAAFENSMDYNPVASASPREDGQPAMIDRLDSLHIFVVDAHVVLFQLPLTLMLLPLAQATGQTHGQGVVPYLSQGLACLAGNNEQGPLCSQAAQYTALYVLCNILWNWTVLLNVKFNGAVATFVALKAISPCSAVLFAYVDWPLMHTTTVHTTTWIVFLAILPCISFYTYASKQQQKREEEDPLSATCCFPLVVQTETADGQPVTLGPTTWGAI